MATQQQRRNILSGALSQLPSGALEIWDLTNTGTAQIVSGLLGAYNLIRGGSAAVESSDPLGNTLDGVDDQWTTSPAVPLGTQYTFMACIQHNGLPSLRPVIGTNSTNAYLGVRNSSNNAVITESDGTQRSSDGKRVFAGSPHIIGGIVVGGRDIRAVTGRNISAPSALGTIPARTLTTLGRTGPVGTLYWPGQIFMVVVWARELSQIEIAKAYSWMRQYLAQKGVISQ